MTKDKARKILESYIDSDLYTNLPIVDKVISFTNKNNKLEQWTFKGLISIAYDLEPKNANKRTIRRGKQV